MPRIHRKQTNHDEQRLPFFILFHSLFSTYQSSYTSADTSNTLNMFPLKRTKSKLMKAVGKKEATAASSLAMSVLVGKNQFLNNQIFTPHGRKDRNLFLK